jgi:hypothetical protein
MWTAVVGGTGRPKKGNREDAVEGSKSICSNDGKCGHSS